MLLHPTKIALHPTKIALHPTNIVLHPTKIALHLTKMDLHPTKIAINPTKMDLHPTKIVQNEFLIDTTTMFALFREMEQREGYVLHPYATVWYKQMVASKSNVFTGRNESERIKMWIGTIINSRCM